MNAKSESIKRVDAMAGELNILDDPKTPPPDRIDEVELYTPAGLAWRATGCHTMILRYPDTIDWDDVLAEIKKGTQPCDVGCEWDDECDIKRPESEGTKK